MFIDFLFTFAIMKTFTLKLITIILGMALLVGCANKRYDISDGYNKDITLFNEEIDVPVGSIGPISVKELLLKSSIGMTLADFFSEDEAGNFLLESENDVHAVNVYQIERETSDISQPFTYSAGSPNVTPSGMAGLLSLLGLTSLDQSISLYATNPLVCRVPMRALLEIKSRDRNYVESIDKSSQISYEIPMMDNEGSPVILNEALPSTVLYYPSSVTLGSLELDLPEEPSKKLYDETKSDVFRFIFKHKGKIGVQPSFSLKQDFEIEDANLSIGKFKLKECELSVQLENTLPLDVVIKRVTLFSINEEGQEVLDENVSFSSDIAIAGGTLTQPSTSAISFRVAAAEGTIPDIHGVRITLEAAGNANLSGVSLSTKQGVRLASSSVKIRGGVTIPLNK